MLFLALVCLNDIFGEESFYRFRIKKDFVKDVFEKNLKMIFERTERIQMRDIFIDGLNA